MPLADTLNDTLRRAIKDRDTRTADVVRMLLREIVIFVRVFDQVVEFNFRLEVEIGFQLDHQLPLGGTPPVLAHPGAFGNVKLALM